MKPERPQLFHILHVDRLQSIAEDGFLWSDSKGSSRPGTTVGMAHIKARRRANELTSRPGLRVGDCVPFYFCPRSIMLYLIYRGNSPDLDYRGGQDSIAHLRVDLNVAVEWAEEERRRWAFTLSNAGSSFFEDRADLDSLKEVDWDSVQARNWAKSDVKEGKQAEFLIEGSFPWVLVEEIGVESDRVARQVEETLRDISHKPPIQLRKDWYY